MKNLSRLPLILFLSIFLLSCSSKVIQSESYKTYTIGKRVTTSVGGTFLEAQNGTISTVKRWVGLIHSPTGYATERVVSPDFVKKELIYSGKSKSTVEISYREFRGGLAAPAFYQSVKYDLDESTIVAFQNFRFEILDASNSSLTVKILDD